MAKPQLRVLFFDTFGTVVAQRKPVADELWKAAQNALQSNTSSISGEVRAKAMKMVCFGKPSTYKSYQLIFGLDIRAVVRFWRRQ